MCVLKQLLHITYYYMAVGQNPGTPVNIPKAFNIDGSLGG